MAKEILAARIVITVGFTRMRNGNTVIVQIADISYVSILESLVRMKAAEKRLIDNVNEKFTKNVTEIFTSFVNQICPVTPSTHPSCDMIYP